MSMGWGDDREFYPCDCRPGFVGSCCRLGPSINDLIDRLPGGNVAEVKDEPLNRRVDPYLPLTDERLARIESLIHDRGIRAIAGTDDLWGGDVLRLMAEVRRLRAILKERV